MAVQRLGIVERRDLPAGEHRDGVGECKRLALIVGDEDRRRRRLGEDLDDVAADLRAQGRVERVERLVQQDHVGANRKCARQRHALLLTA